MISNKKFRPPSTCPDRLRDGASLYCITLTLMKQSAAPLPGSGARKVKASVLNNSVAFTKKEPSAKNKWRNSF